MIDQPISDHQFEQHLQNGLLMGSRCSDCKALFVPPRTVCSNCQSTDLAWDSASGKGTLIAFTSIAIGTPAMLKLGYDRNNPYISAVIELEEGSRVVARLDQVDARNPESIPIGLPVQVQFPHDRLQDGLVFVPQSSLG